MTFAHFLCRHTHTHTHAKAIPNKSFPESSQEKMHCEKKNISIVSSNERASAFRDDAQTETFGFGMAWVWLQSNQSYSSRMSSSTWWSLVRLARNISLCKKVNLYIYIYSHRTFQPSKDNTRKRNNDSDDRRMSLFYMPSIRRWKMVAHMTKRSKRRFVNIQVEHCVY